MAFFAGWKMAHFDFIGISLLIRRQRGYLLADTIGGSEFPAMIRTLNGVIPSGVRNDAPFL